MKKYSFLNKVLTVTPVGINTPIGVEINDFAEGGDVIQGDRREDGFTDQVGADGKMLVIQTSNKSGLILLRLQMGSNSSPYLNNLYKAQENADFQPVAVRYKDVVSGEQFEGTQGYITKPAPFLRGDDANVEEWAIVVEDYDAIFATLDLLGGVVIPNF